MTTNDYECKANAGIAYMFKLYDVVYRDRRVPRVRHIMVHAPTTYYAIWQARWYIHKNADDPKSWEFEDIKEMAPHSEDEINQLINRSYSNYIYAGKWEPKK